MSNPFKADFDKLAERLLELQKLFFHINLMFERERQKKDEILGKTVKRNDQKAFSRLVIRDIIGEENTGRGTNRATKYTSEFTWDEYDEELNKMLSNEACYLAAQSCEAINSFLKDMLAIQLFLNKNVAQNVSSKLSSINTITNFKEHFKTLKLSKDTESIFEKLCETCPYFEKARFTNHWDIDLTIVYEVIAKARHKITHNSSMYHSDYLKDWSEAHFKVFEKYFTPKEISGRLLLTMNYHQGLEVIKNIAELAFVVFKSLSVCNKYEWSIFIESNK